MDFFEHQDVARRNTTRLMVLFALAVICTIVAIYLLIAVTTSVPLFRILFQIEGASVYLRPARPLGWGEILWQPRLLGWVMLGVLIVVGGGSLYRIQQLSRGGAAVAATMGARRVDPEQASPEERRLLNIVEEMAIAAGLPPPPVYVMDKEPGINAFAAGFSSDDAVIGVTSGCLKRLDRDELQGVVAHEFSHILNGDMRLNLQLMGVVHGILMVGLIGRLLMESSLRGSRRSSGSGSRNSSVPSLVIGLGLTVIGFVGVFFGNLIKAAISRQREYLADAAAVQFTRNAPGVSGALKKIGGHLYGSRVDRAHAAELSHMFFGRHRRGWFGDLFSTHPQLELRILRIEPTFDGRFPRLTPEPISEEPGETSHAGAGGSRAAVALGAVLPAAALLEQVGRPGPVHLEYARELLDSLPVPLAAAARDLVGAQALIHGLLVAKAAGVRAEQLAHLDQHAADPVRRSLNELLPWIERLDTRARLPLLDLAIGTLAGLSPDQYTAFKENVRALMEADRRTDLFEWVLGRMLLRHLAGRFETTKRRRPHYYALKPLAGACACLLSTLAYAGHASSQAAGEAFTLAAGSLGIGPLKLWPMEQCTLDELDRALEALADLAPRFKRQVLGGAIVCVSADGQATEEEAELLRAIADALDCPVPPLLPGQRL